MRNINQLGRPAQQSGRRATIDIGQINRPTPHQRKRCGFHHPVASRLGTAVITQLIGIQVRLVQALRATIRELDTLIGQATTTHPWAALITGLPGSAGTINLGQVIGEIGPILEGMRTEYAGKGPRGR